MADGQATKPICSNTDCRVHEDGKCVEGMSFSDCPYYGKEAESDQATVETTSKVEPIVLPSAAKLSVEEACDHLRRDESRVIAIIGPSEAGKTSLIAGLYELFQKGPVHGAQFARSCTLHAFEQACHDARTDSEREEAHSPRTLPEGVAYYHLCLTPTGSSRFCNIILADRFGEDYRDAPNGPVVGDNFAEIQRADVITILVDGSRLLSNITKHEARSSIEMMLRVFVEYEVIFSKPKLAIVLTKIDEIEVSENKDKALDFFSTICDRLKTLLGSHFSESMTFKTAASPKNTTVQAGVGLPDVLNFWLERQAIESVPPRHVLENHRMIDLYEHEEA